MDLADAKTENIELKNKIRELESMDGDPCPKCHKRSWNIEPKNGSYSAKPIFVSRSLGVRGGVILPTR